MSTVLLGFPGFGCVEPAFQLVLPTFYLLLWDGRKLLAAGFCCGLSASCLSEAPKVITRHSIRWSRRTALPDQLSHKTLLKESDVRPLFSFLPFFHLPRTASPLSFLLAASLLIALPYHTLDRIYLGLFPERRVWTFGTVSVIECFYECLIFLRFQIWRIYM